MFDTAVEVSPAGWTCEARGRPTLGRQLPSSSPLLDLDRPAADHYVLIVDASARHLDADEAAYHDDDDESFEVPDLRVDWDSLLDAALTEVGLQMPFTPDWLWYRTSFAD